MFDLYIDGFRTLWEFREFRIVFHVLRYAILATASVVILLILLHVIYMLGRNSPLYRRRSPARGWDKRFFPASLALLVVLIALYLVSGAWTMQAS